jgi:hypothetical protein
VRTTFRGFVDDSGEGDAPGDPVFVLGGFISSVERWAAFSKEWRGALDDAPSINYFKMAEAANLSAKGQFARRLGWTEANRNAKLELLTGVIVRHVELKVNCSVDKVAFAKYARSLAVPQRTSIINKPYAMAFQRIILATAAVFLTYQIPQSCDFIFDEQGKIGQDAVAMWEVVKQGRPDFGPYLGNVRSLRMTSYFSHCRRRTFTRGTFDVRFLRMFCTRRSAR